MKQNEQVLTTVVPEKENELLVKQNAQVLTTVVTQKANELLGTKDRQLYYLVIETAKGKHVMNVGKETHTKVIELTGTV